MFLFLDVISPLPEFFVIEDNKVVFNKKIIKSESNKISDNIFQVYYEINNELNLSKYLKKTAITIGPGSYTSLRVGAAFISGLNISKEIQFCPISILDIFNFKSTIINTEDTAIFISSSSNQDFICTMNKDQNVEYKKYEDDFYDLPNNINTILYNYKKLDYEKDILQQHKFSFINEILENQSKLDFKKENMVKPIYISNNKILN